MKLIGTRTTRAMSALATVFLVVTCHTSLVTVLAQTPAKGIQDNSFFVEEAYNQEAGVVQHIINLPIAFTGGEKEVTPSFTQEWPLFSQTHQLSYTLPYNFNSSDNGFGDIALHYRYQVLMETDRQPAFAPSFTLALPTGDRDKGFGSGRVGYETNLPFSKVVSDRWTVHFNAGASLVPDVQGHDLVNYNLGASAIYGVSNDFNFMFEMVADWEEEVDEVGHVDQAASVLISPGARYAFNLPDDLQIVLGAAVPVGVSSDSPDWGMFFYLSFEHPFSRVSAR